MKRKARGTSSLEGAGGGLRRGVDALSSRFVKMGLASSVSRIDALPIGGRYYDVVLMGLLRREFEERCSPSRRRRPS
jgi:hypothetical protein